MIDEANRVLVAKGYSAAQLAVHSSPRPGKALLKGSKIASPFADGEETVLWVVENCIPTFAELGRRTITPHELRACLERA